MVECFFFVAGNEAAEAVEFGADGEGARARGGSDARHTRRDAALLGARRHGARLRHLHHQGGEGFEAGPRWTETARPGWLFRAFRRLLKTHFFLELSTRLAH